jgi:hypothetical protein
MLERVDAHVDGILHLVEDGLVPAGDRHVIADIGADLRRGFAMPFVDRILDAAIGPGQAEIHQHRGATTGRRPCAGLECLGGGGAHEGHLKMGMRINPAGDHISPLGVDIFVAFQVFADLLDRLILDQNICLPRAIRRADSAVFDDFGGHVISPFFIPCACISSGWKYPGGVALARRGQRPQLFHNLRCLDHRMHQHIRSGSRPVLRNFLGLVMA